MDRASSRTAASAAEHERKRALVRRLTLALASDKAVGAARSKLYCSRASAYEDLAAPERISGGPTLASRALASDPADSVFVVVWKDRAGAATLVKGKNGSVLLADASVVEGTDAPFLFARLASGATVALDATVERRDENIGLAVLRPIPALSNPALALAERGPEKDELVFAIGHPQASGLWTKTSGLVVKAGADTFQADAVVAPEMAGGPVLNEAGEVSGVLVLRKVVIEGKEENWPVGVPAPVIVRWLEGAESAPASGAVDLDDAGTSAILSRAHSQPLTETGLGAWVIPPLPPPPPTPRSVCVSNCGGGSSRSYTNYTNPRSSYGSSYSGGSSYNSGGAELGEALGKLIVVIISKGIPALFRGIAKLFKKSDKPATSSVAKAAPAPKPVPKAPEKPKEPPKLVGLTLDAAPKSVASGEKVTLTARATLSDPEASKVGIVVSFAATPDTIARFAGPASAKTDGSGTATITVTLRDDHGVRAVKTGDAKAVREKSNRAQNDLDEEARAINSETADESGVESRRNENVQFEARASLRGSASANASVVLANAPAKPECRLELVDTPKSVGDEAFTIKAHFACAKIEGQPDATLGGHDVVLSLGWDGQAPQHELRLRTNANGDAFAVFQAKSDIEELPLPSATNASFVNAASPGAVIAPAAEVVADPAVRQLVVTGGYAMLIRGTATIILSPAASTALLVVVGVGVVSVAWDMYDAQKKYDDALAALQGSSDKKLTCPKVRYRELNAEVGHKCKTVSRSCSDEKVSKGDCAELKDRIRLNNDCIAARELLMHECFGGGDPVHHGLVNIEKEVLKYCAERFNKECK